MEEARREDISAGRIRLFLCDEKPMALARSLAKGAFRQPLEEYTK